MDHEQIEGLLVGLDDPDRTARRDETCDVVARRYLAEGIEPAFLVDRSDFGDTKLLTADRYWRLRLVEKPTVVTAIENARWLYSHVAHDAQESLVCRWALGYGFVTRDVIESEAELDAAADDYAEADPRVLAYACVYHAGKLRAGFRFDELHVLLTESLLARRAGSALRDTLLFEALCAFADFGRRGHITTALAGFERVWASPQRTPAITDLLLNGLGVSVPFDGKGQLLIARAHEAITCDPGSHGLYYLLSQGYSLCGQHAVALEAIDTAITLLPATGWRSSFSMLSEQYAARRIAIQDASLVGPARTVGGEVAAPFRRVVLAMPLAAAFGFAINAGAVLSRDGADPLSERVLELGVIGTVLVLMTALGVWAFRPRTTEI